MSTERTGKKMVMLLLGFLLLTGILFPKQVVEAASQKSRALRAYQTFLSGNTMTWPGTSTKISLKKCNFSLVYVDKDSVPELVLFSGSNSNSHADGYYLLYTYKNGKVKFVTNLMDDFFYYKKKGVFGAIHTGTGGFESFYYKLSKGKAAFKLYVQNEKKANWDFNGDGKITINYEKVTKLRNPYYNSSTKKIKKAAFQKELKKMVGGTKKSCIRTYYRNTADNRARQLGR